MNRSGLVGRVAGYTACWAPEGAHLYFGRESVSCHIERRWHFKWSHPPVRGRARWRQMPLTGRVPGIEAMWNLQRPPPAGGPPPEAAVVRRHLSGGGGGGGGRLL